MIYNSADSNRWLILAGSSFLVVLVTWFIQPDLNSSTQSAVHEEGPQSKAEELPSARAEERPHPIVNSIDMKLIRIPSGTFVMGSTEMEEGRFFSEGPKHKVRIVQSFLMGIYEVTQGQYEKVIGTNPAVFKIGPNHPVEQVSWEQAVEFCHKLSELPAEKAAKRTYRLPTEAEWEYACRAGSTTSFHAGKALTDKQANCRGLGRTVAVGTYAPNAFGLYDMHGNVWEWCQDWYDGGYYRESAEENPAGPETGATRVIRGGGWDSTAAQSRSAARESFTPTNLFNDIGFRVICLIDKP